MLSPAARATSVPSRSPAALPTRPHRFSQTRNTSGVRLVLRASSLHDRVRRGGGPSNVRYAGFLRIGYAGPMGVSSHNPATIGATELPPVSSGAAAALEQSLPTIVQAVSERLRVEAAFAPEAFRGDSLESIQDSQAHFGHTLLGLCACGLAAHLPGEAAWYLRTLEHRDSGE